MAVLRVKDLQPSTGDKNLSPEDVKTVQDTWELVKQDIKGNGFDLFINFFTHFPDYQKNFKSFANVPINELRGNKRVSAHANNVLYTLTGVIDSITDTEVFIEMIEKMTENHLRRKIQYKQFENLGLVVVDFLIQKLGDEVMNQQAIDAWKKAYLVILSIVANVIERIEKDEKN